MDAALVVYIQSLEDRIALLEEELSSKNDQQKANDFKVVKAKRIVSVPADKLQAFKRRG